MGPQKRRWFDDAAGPVVRPYAVTRGRAREHGEPFDLISIVVAGDPMEAARFRLDPEYHRLLESCRRPITVADLASVVDLPLGVVRVLLGDLRDNGLVRTQSSPSPTDSPDQQILRKVLDELRTL